MLFLNVVLNSKCSSKFYRRSSYSVVFVPLTITMYLKRPSADGFVCQYLGEGDRPTLSEEPLTHRLNHGGRTRTGDTSTPDFEEELSSSSPW